MSPWLEAACLAAMLVGLVGVLIPVLPGLVLIVASGVVWAVLDGGGWTRWATVLAMLLVGVVLTVVRVRQENAQREVDSLRRMAHSY